MDPVRAGTQPLPDLLGRERDLAAVDALLQAHRLVSVVGAAGIGKTVMGRRLAARAGPLGLTSCWVDLSPLDRDDPIDETILTAIRGLLPAASLADATNTEQAVRALGPALIVIDNCEHVTASVATVVERLIDQCPQCRVLTTTRSALALPDETVWRLGALACPPLSVTTVAELVDHPAAALFVDRARRSGRPLTDDDAPAIASVCHLLDGNPLALVIAASRSGALSIPELAGSLAASNAVLATANDAVSGRHRDVIHSILWSCELLTAAARRVLHAVAAFPDGFTLPHAAAVLGEVTPGADPAASLAQLVEVGLLDFDGSSRYRLTFVVRHVVRDVDADREILDAATAVHARITIERLIAANRWGASIDPMLVDTAAADIRAALRWAVRHDDLLAYRGIVGFGVMLAPATQHELCEWLSTRTERIVDWALAVGWLSILAPVSARPLLAPLLPDAVQIAAAASDDHAARVLRCTPVYVQCLLGDPAPALALATEARDADDGWITLAVGSVGSLIAARLGNVPLMRDFAELTAWACTQGRLPYCMTAAAVAEATVLQQRGDLAAADRALDAVIAQPAVRGAVLEARLDLAIDRNDEDAARVIADASAETDDPLGRFTHSRAHAWLTQAGEPPGPVAVLTAPGVPWEIERSIERAAALASDPDSAGPILDRAEEALRSMPTDAPLLSTRLAIVRARVELARGCVAEAETVLLGAIAVARANQLDLALCDALEVAAQVAAERSNDRLAARLVGATETFRARTGYLDRRRSGPQVGTALADAVAEGKTLDLDRAAALARRSRGERRRPAFGLESLTPTEWMVAELVAAGHTNAEIADRMLISRATVKTHLTRTFAKLGVGNRTQLAVHVRSGATDGCAR